MIRARLKYTARPASTPTDPVMIAVRMNSRRMRARKGRAVFARAGFAGARAGPERGGPGGRPGAWGDMAGAYGVSTQWVPASIGGSWHSRSTSGGPYLLRK